MSAEPISTRIARLKGCEPVSDGAGGWMCQCALNTHGDWCDQCSDRHEYINEGWLTPAASFALLAEMVDAEDPASELGRGFGGYWADQAIRNARTGVPLGEAIALAYEAYATAKEVRQ